MHNTIFTQIYASAEMAYLSEKGITVNLLHTSLKKTGEGVLGGGSEGVEGRKEEEEEEGRKGERRKEGKRDHVAILYNVLVSADLVKPSF